MKPWGVAPTNAPCFGNVPAAALHVIRDGWVPAHECHCSRCSCGYESPPEGRHLLIGPAFLFASPNRVAINDDFSVVWLLSTPITDAERQNALEKGADALSPRFEDHDLPFCALDRPSLV